MTRHRLGILARIVFWMLRRNGPPPTAEGFDAFIRQYHPEASPYHLAHRGDAGRGGQVVNSTDRTSNIDDPMNLVLLARVGTGETFIGQMTWLCTCGHPKGDHYFGDALDAKGQMHTSCQWFDGCHDFAPSDD